MEFCQFEDFIKYKWWKSKILWVSRFHKRWPCINYYNFQAKSDIEISGFMTATISWEEENQ